MDLLGRLFGLILSASDVLLLLGAYWLVTGLAKRRAAAERLLPDQINDSSFWLGLGAVVGARLVYIAPTWPAFLRNPLDLLRVQTGLSFYGAVIGTLIVAGWLARRGRLPLARTADLYAPYLALGLALYRAGCLVRGDCFGAQAPAPLGVVFPGLTQPRYPAELYEAILALGLCGLLLWWRSRRRFPGEVGLAFLTVYPLLRAAVDLSRINLGGWPSPDQLISVGFATAAGLTWAARARREGPSSKGPLLMAAGPPRGGAEGRGESC